MPHKRKTPYTGLEYSEWHREASIVRFINKTMARNLTMIDKDMILPMDPNNPQLWTEICSETHKPLAHVEAMLNFGSWKRKQASATKYTAEDSGLIGLLVQYQLSEQPNPANTDVQDIKKFWVQILYPDFWGEEFFELSPQKFAEFLVRCRHVGEKLRRNKDESIDRRVSDIETKLEFIIKRFESLNKIKPISRSQ